MNYELTLQKWYLFYRSDILINRVITLKGNRGIFQHLIPSYNERINT